MKKIIVTGCNGQLGRAVNELYKGNSEYELINTDFNVEGVRNLDITNIAKQQITVKIEINNLPNPLTLKKDLQK